MNLFNLFAKLTLDSSEYEKGLEKSEKQASSFSSKAKKVFKGVATAVGAVVGAAAACAGALAKLTAETIKQAGAIDDAAKQLQLTTTQYQEWDWIMRQIGADSSTLSMAFRQLATFTGNLTSGNADATIAMQKLGLSTQNFLNLDTEAQLTAMIRAFQGMKQGIEKTTLAQQVFGARAYQMLLPILNDTVGSVDKLKTEIHDLGLIMSEEAVSTGEKLGDELEYMKGAVKQLAFSLGTELFPALEKVISGITAFVTGSGDINEAIDNIIDGVMDITDKLIDYLPRIIDISTDILPKILMGIVSKTHEIVPALLRAIERLLFTVIDILPDVVAGLGEIITALIKGLLQLDWGTLVVELIFAIMDILFTILPDIVDDILDIIFDLFTGEKGTNVFEKIGKKLGEALINGIIPGIIEFVINSVISVLNLITKVISLLWTSWSDVPAIPEIPKVSIPRPDISFMAQGGMMEGVGTAYVVGEGGAEIIAQGSRGTGVANVEQIADAVEIGDYNALRRFFGNGVTIRIGDKDFAAYIVKATNQELRSQGRKTLDQITRW